MALKLSNVATFPSTLSKHLVDSVQIISTTFRLYQDSKGSRCWEALSSSTRSHAHSKRFGLNVDLAAELETDFAWVPPLAAEAAHADDWAISSAEIDKAFDSLEKEVAQGC